ncbi:WD40 repeat domain-containing protein [Actinoplanes sp. NPDC049265]|uniref:WD40 repeat domain-containing protein n=1 Tax=Actinoplanes sp. NPDC049265 TaxID=3363902 RepID=UPI003710B722
MFAVTLEDCRCESLAFSPDATLLAVGGSNGLVGLWRVDTGRPLRHFVHDLLGHPVRAVAFAPDGTLLAAVGGDHLKVRDLRTGRLIFKRQHPAVLTAVAIDETSTCIATACTDGTLRLWSRRGELTSQEPNACTAETTRLTFAGDRPVATAGPADAVTSGDGRWTAVVTGTGVQVRSTVPRPRAS